MSTGTKSPLAGLGWAVQLGAQALEALARAAKLPLPRAPATVAGGSPEDLNRLGEWLDAVAQSQGLELDLRYTRHAEVESTLLRASPALLEVFTAEEGLQLIALLGTSAARGTARILAPDETVRDIPLSLLTTSVQALVEWDLIPTVDRVLERTRLPEPQLTRARKALLGAQLANTHLVAARTLRLPPGAKLPHHLGALSAAPRVMLLLVLAVLIQGCVLAGWWLMGQGAFEGQLDTGWLWAWALMGLTAVPLQAALAWTQGTLALDLSALLRRRLLTGALSLPVDEARRGGIGEYVGRTFESAGMEQMALAGSFTSLLAVVDLSLAASVTLSGPAGWLGLLALGAYCAVLGVLVVRQSQLFKGWTESRVVMTHALIERMLGHRTRLAQEQPSRWHEEEDQELARYAEASERWDAGTARVMTLARRGLLPVAIIATLPGVLAGASTASIAVGVGAALLGARAVMSLAAGSLALVGARVLFASVRPMLDAARLAPGATSHDTEDAAPQVAPLTSGDAPPKDQSLLELRDVFFKHPTSPRAVLERTSLTLHPGERVLLEGPSGSGKSTLASILTGLRRQGSGVVLLRGLDMATWTPGGWGAQIAGAPQFHENHIISGTLAMNVLLGRAWPHTQDDLKLARELCEELGLGDLLQRMPAGVLQMVGERGWQLSHGEQSRIFVARALLQRVQVVVLDEAFGALDPVTMRKVMACVEARAPTLVVIAHP
ncbi:ABC transporter ATP-binding protein [Myxococcus stipitatus DSM 14675]|uniref:ABC transporter ATP-binding protein n=1 Tax=Myxococcus stipitatus (strain DSM 14675 / JCM 12634 / Mx s8) TaxID=1278073 RepID=L7UBV8_MYXSD|nr:ABC transporter ATP-binding protein [Myxococcus stipitatus]AGC43919.1 ABC transporter ATP-binding protein [Myxococcus stipitatus DSM 14675]